MEKKYKQIRKRIYDPAKLGQFLIDVCEQYQKCELVSTPVDIGFTDIPYEFIITTWEEE